SRSRGRRYLQNGKLLNAHGQDAAMRNAGLNGVERSVARRWVSEDQFTGQIRAKPRRRVSRHDLRDAFFGFEQRVTADPAKTGLVEQEWTVEIARGIQRQRARAPALCTRWFCAITNRGPAFRRGDQG